MTDNIDYKTRYLYTAQAPRFRDDDQGYLLMFLGDGLLPKGDPAIIVDSLVEDRFPIFYNTRLGCFSLPFFYKERNIELLIGSYMKVLSSNYGHASLIDEIENKSKIAWTTLRMYPKKYGIQVVD